MDLPQPTARPLRAIELRHLLTWHLHQHRSLTVRQLVALLEGGGFTTLGRPSKSISDALRWEVARGRVIRVGRGRYVAGHIPRSTLGRIRRRVQRIHAGEATSYWAILPAPPSPITGEGPGPVDLLA